MNKNLIIDIWYNKENMLEIYLDSATLLAHADTNDHFARLSKYVEENDIDGQYKRYLSASRPNVRRMFPVEIM